MLLPDVKSNDIIRVGKVGQRHQPVLQLEKDERYLVGLIMYILNIFVPLLQRTGNFSKRTSSFFFNCFTLKRGNTSVSLQQTGTSSKRISSSFFNWLTHERGNTYVALIWEETHSEVCFTQIEETHTILYFSTLKRDGNNIYCSTLKAEEMILRNV